MLAALNPGALEAVKHSGFAEHLGHKRMRFKAEGAIDECIESRKN